MRRKTDTLLGHCLARAMIAAHGDPEAALAATERGEKLGAWQATRLAVKATPTASRVAGFIVMWAVALDELDVAGELSPELFADWSPESRSTVYRRILEFEALFAPEYETPTVLARLLIAAARSRGESITPTLAVAL